MKTNLLKQVSLLAILFVLVSQSNADTVKSLGSSDKINFDRNSVGFQLNPKHYTFQGLQSGDCVMQTGSTIDIFPDGHASFTSTVWTNHTHSGDTWHHHIFFINAAGAVIFKVDIDGPNHMNDDGSRYAFSSNFNFPPAIFDSIAMVQVRGNC